MRVENIIKRGNYLAEKIVFIDGMPGCGKTLLSNLVSGLNRVELLSYSYEIEHLVQLFFLNKIDENVLITMTQMYLDLKIYNTMMGRDLNFRYNDLSSVFKNHNSIEYLQRIFQPGDDAVINKIKNHKPILNISTHNIFPISLPIINALGKRCFFIEMIRHPVYMIKQQMLNMERLLNDNPKYFSVNFEFEGKCIPFFTKGWETQFLKSNSYEKSVLYIKHETEKKNKIRSFLKEKKDCLTYTLSFESLVIEPLKHIQIITELLETEITNKTFQVMREQNVPRLKVSESIDLEIYKRCGWKEMNGLTEFENMLELQKEIEKNINKDVKKILQQLVNDYEMLIWSPKNGLIS